MSLINQMLQDLEKRQSGGETAGLAAHVAAVPRCRRISLFWPLILLLMAAAGGLVWPLLQTQAPSEAAVAQPAKIAPTLQPAKAPSPAIIAEAAPPAPPKEIPAANAQVEPIPPPPATSPPPADAPVLKPSTTLTLALKASPAALPKPPEPLLTVATAEPLKRMAPSAGLADAGKQTPPATDTVAKQVREVTPRQQAENEYRKALPLLQQGRVEEAMDGLAQALRLDPRHAAARQALIGLLVEARRYGEAERRLQEGLALDPGQAELAMTLARLQVERGDVRNALATLERTLPHAAEQPAYQAFLAALLQREERHREAIEHYQLATRKAPQSGVWLMGLGISLHAENRFQEARQTFSRAKATNSLSPELQSFVEQRLKQLGQ